MAKKSAQLPKAELTITPDNPGQTLAEAPAGDDGPPITDEEKRADKNIHFLLAAWRAHLARRSTT